MTTISIARHHETEDRDPPHKGQTPMNKEESRRTRNLLSNMWILPYGYYASRTRNSAAPFPWRWMQHVHSLLAGNGDLHSLVRCPPLARRWNREASMACDIGCGSGDFHLDTLMRTNFKGTVIGVDKNHEGLRRAQELAQALGLKSRIHYVCASAENLPFRDSVFDQVFLVDVIEHVANDGHVFQEVHRVLREDALLELSTPTPLYPVVFGRRIHNAVGHVRDGYRMDDLTREIRRFDFDVITTSQNTGYLLWPWMALWFRIAWKGLWDPGPKNPVVRCFYHCILVLLSIMVRLLNPLDRLGGYCSSDVESRKKSHLHPSDHE